MTLKIALLYALACHGIFALAGLAMLVQLHQGMTLGLGPFEGWAALIANALLLAQFPLGHSGFLIRRGQGALARLAPFGLGKTLAATSYATIASVQLLLLFVLWSPSGMVWVRLEGAALVAMTLAYLGVWALLTKAIFDAGPTLQAAVVGGVAQQAAGFPADADQGSLSHRSPADLCQLRAGIVTGACVDTGSACDCGQLPSLLHVRPSAQGAWLCPDVWRCI